jgi:hypothetical protein
MLYNRRELWLLTYSKFLDRDVSWRYSLRKMSVARYSRIEMSMKYSRRDIPRGSFD